MPATPIASCWTACIRWNRTRIGISIKRTISCSPAPSRGKPLFPRRPSKRDAYRLSHRFRNAHAAGAGLEFRYLGNRFQSPDREQVHRLLVGPMVGNKEGKMQATEQSVNGLQASAENRALVLETASRVALDIL